VFADLGLEAPKEAASTFEPVFMFRPWSVLEKAGDGGILANREILDIFQRNLNAGFSLLRRLAEARSLREVSELQAAYWSNQVAALIGQSEELLALSIKAATDIVSAAYSRP
jgi:hypothetical protein